jgi:DDE superfamily endonuclease
MYYSGKKKRYTIKNQIMVNKYGYILHKIAYKKGRRHDYDIYKRNHPVTPKQVVTVADLGYQDMEKDYPDQLSVLPYKKKINQFLSEEEKDYNRIHSKMRIVIEHTICRLKKYRIMSDIFRNKLRKHNKIADIVTSLVNYRIMNQCL